jgi:hypothetical protein
LRRVLVAALAVIAVSLALPVSAARAAPSGQWKVDCTYVKSASDDPIVLPNLPGASHPHDFFGNAGVSAYSCAVPKLTAQALSWHFSTNDMIGLIAARRPYLTLIPSPAKIDT